MDLGLTNKHVIITGASSGIGLETTRKFLQEGAQVTACFRTDPRQLTDIEEEYSSHLNLVKADISKESDVEFLFAEACNGYGRVDIAVANAGIANHEGIGVHEMSLEQWNRIVSVNLTGAFLTAKHFFQNLESNPGDHASLVLIGSTAGVFGEAWYSDYSTSKAGMHGLMMSLKNEIVHLAERGRVNIVNPGWTLTPMAEEAMADSIMVSRIFQTLPMRKIATSSDIANAILFLSSDTTAGHISGQTITLAGGMEGRVLFTPDEVKEYVDRLTSR
ncbi:MAG: SDR family NAD(P)-dependent oxidoreductase [Candidatus Thorarchaeota archaeon]